MSGRGNRGDGRPHHGGPTARERAARLLADGPDPDSPSRYGAITHLARRAAARLNRHAHRHRDAVAAQTLAALDDLEAALTDRLVALEHRVEEARDGLAVVEPLLLTLEVRLAELAVSAPVAAAGAGAEVGAWRRRLDTAWSSMPPPAAAVEPPVVCLDTEVGRLLLPASDRVLLPIIRETGRWETEESEQLEAWLRPGMTFVDIGAHVGFMTLLGARAVGAGGRVLAVEPAPGNVALLRANVLANGMANVEVLPGAALDRSGSVALSLSTTNTGDNRAYEVAETESVEVAAYALDEVLPDDLRVDVVKVDTQGTDHLAIRGMARTLARSRSRLLVEFWPEGILGLGDEPAAVVKGYQQQGFEVRVLGEGAVGPPPTPEAVVASASAAHGGFCNLVLEPAD